MSQLLMFEFVTAYWTWMPIPTCCQTGMSSMARARPEAAELDRKADVEGDLVVSVEIGPGVVADIGGARLPAHRAPHRPLHQSARRRKAAGLLGRDRVVVGVLEAALALLDEGLEEHPARERQAERHAGPERRQIRAVAERHGIGEHIGPNRGADPQVGHERETRP